MAGGMRASSPKLVGRREELSRGEALLDAARSGTAQTVLVAGDAGIGKTRFVQELAQHALALDMTVVTGGCIDLGDDALPYAPFVQLLHTLTAQLGTAEVLELAGATGDELSRLAPELAVGGDVPEVSRASASRLYLALTALLGGLARRRPLVIVVEDIHWADRSTRDLLALLSHNAPRRSLLVVTLRSDEADDPALRRFTAELERSAAHRIALRPLSRADQARQISGILGVPPSSALVDRVYDRADGNPFFAEEILALDPTTADVPTTVRDLLLARVDALPASSQAVLRTAAAAGRRVSHELLAAVVELDGGALDDALRTAVRNHILLADPRAGGAYVFRHSLLQESIATTLLPGEAARIHRRLAEALTDDASSALDRGHGVAGRIAHHWHAAGDTTRTLQASITAAKEAEKALAFAEASTHYDRAVGLLDDVADADVLLPMPRYQLLWAAAEVAHLAAFPRRAAERVREAIAACDPARQTPGARTSVDQVLHFAYLHERLGRYLWMAADGAGAMASYRRAVDLVPADPTCWRAAILSGYAQMLLLAGHFADAVPICREAIALTQHPDVESARSTEGHARNNLGVCLALLGDVEEGIEHLRAARRIAEEEFDDVDDIARAIVNLDSVLFDLGRYDEAAAVALEGISVVDKLGLKRRKGVWCRCDAAEALLALGRCGDALRLTDESLALAPDGVDALRTHMVRGRTLLQLGRIDDGWRHLREAHERSARVIDGRLNGVLFAAMVECAAWRGDVESARALAAEGMERLLDDEDAAYLTPLCSAVSRAAAEAGDSDEAHRWVRRSEMATERDPARKPPARAHALVARGELSRAGGTPDPAAWAAAAVAWRELGDPYGEAYAAWRHAEALLACGDRDAAGETLRVACHTARSCDAAHLAGEIEDLARRSRLRLDDTAADATPRGGPFGLTRREREVVELVAEGLSDREIGEQLFISHRTVERHVSNILPKVGAARRAEVAAIAHRSGLARAPVG